MKYRLAIFDFDGTLADSFPFFIGVFNQVAERHDFRKIDSDMVPALRHYDARQLLDYTGLPAWKLPLVARSFISLMRDHGQGIPLFPDVDDTLQYLADAGVGLAVVTSNSHDNAVRILGPRNTKLIDHFECGMSIFGKAARIRKVIRKAAVPGSAAIYIGDQATDMEAARQEGVACGAVAWGYGTIESLRKHRPEEEFEHVSAIRRIA